MTFDKKEKKEIEETLSVVLKDLRKLYESSSTEELSTSFSIPGDYGSAYNLCVKKDKDMETFNEYTRSNTV